MTNQTPIHLCIATGQNAANLIPLKQLNAKRVMILQTPDMKAQHSGANLKTALSPYVENIQLLSFDDSTPQNIEKAAESIAYKLDGQDVVFHVTGGTKLMVLSLHEQLKLLGAGAGTLEVVYTDTQHQVLNWLGTQKRQQPMQDQLSLVDLLLVRGYRTLNDTRPAKDQKRAQARAKVSRYMGDHAQSLGGFFSALAYKAGSANESGFLEQRFDYPPGGSAIKLLELAKEQGMLNWEKGQSELHFADQDSARFFAGGWTEEFVFLKLPSLLPPTQYATNAKVIQNSSKTENEIDAIAVKNNRALLVECKSGRQNKAQDAIYKLRQVVQQVGGLMAQGLYVSAQKVSDSDRSRAKEYGVHVLAGEELQELSQFIRNWAKS